MQYNWTPSPQFKELFWQPRVTSVSELQDMYDSRNLVLADRSTQNFRNLLKALTKSGPVSILMPEYICRSFVTNSTKDLNVHVGYYPILENLNPDWDFLQNVKSENRTTLFLLVHYFGKQSDIIRAKSFCKDRQYFLIEDAAHCVEPTRNEVDATLYSPYKIFSIPRGAVMTLGHELSKRLKTENQEFFPNSADLRWKGKKLLQKSLPDMVYRFLPRQKVAFEEDPIPKDAPSVEIDNWTIQKLVIDLRNSDKIFEQRKSNWKAWANFFESQNLAGAPLELTVKECPYMFAYKFASSETAKTFYETVNASRQLVQTWPDLPAGLDSKIFSVSSDLRKRILFLPVHQSMNMRHAINIFKSHLGVFQ
jgi:dTDP-4-amino-4,6-dideoxygalactose transaminase